MKTIFNSIKSIFYSRQTLKIFIFIMAYTILLVVSGVGLLNAYKLFNGMFVATVSTTSNLLHFLILLICFIFEWYSIDKILTYSKRKYPSVLISPLLDKKIIHEAGTYYMSYNGNEYVLYEDMIFYKKDIEKVNESYVDEQTDLKDAIKTRLDYINSKKIKLKRKKEILYNWDGYTSDIIKRDDKINQIVK